MAQDMVNIRTTIFQSPIGEISSAEYSFYIQCPEFDWSLGNIRHRRTCHPSWRIWYEDGSVGSHMLLLTIIQVPTQAQDTLFRPLISLDRSQSMRGG